VLLRPPVLELLQAAHPRGRLGEHARAVRLGVHGREVREPRVARPPGAVVRGEGRVIQGHALDHVLGRPVGEPAVLVLELAQVLGEGPGVAECGHHGPLVQVPKLGGELLRVRMHLLVDEVVGREGLCPCQAGA
ncbi:unnamed protein product, partial [Heterosigma akashiwo]